MRPYWALLNYFQASPTLLQAALRASTWTIFCPQPADENNSLTLDGETPPLLLHSFTPYFQVSLAPLHMYGFVSVFRFINGD